MDGNLYIERIDIGAFGGLSRKSLCFGQGISLIGAPNESGKSTLAAALRFALYGFKGGRSPILENPKKLYTPWSGAAATVAVTIGGSRRMRIERSVQGTKEQASCTDLVTGRALFTGQCFGEQIFGISAETFEKTLFFSTLNPPKSSDGELASALQNLVFSADEQLSTETAVNVLKAHKNALNNNRSAGELLRLAEEEHRLEQQLVLDKRALEKLNLLEVSAMQTENTARIRKELVQRLEEEKHNLDKYKAALLLKEYGELKERAAAAKRDFEAMPYAETELSEIEECRTAKEQLLRTEEKLDKARERSQAAQSALPPQKADGAALLKAQKSCNGRKRAAGALLALAVAAAIFGACALLLLPLNELVGYAAVAAGAVLAVLSAVLSLSAGASAKKAGYRSVAELHAAVAALPAQRAEYEKLRVEAENAETLLRQALAERENARRVFAALVPSLDLDEVERMYTGYVAASEKRAFLQAAENAVKSFEVTNDPMELEALAKGAVKPSRIREEIETEYRFATQTSEKLYEKLNGIKSEIAVLRASGSDPADTESKLAWTRARYAERNGEYKALLLAMQEIEAASDEMRSSISPRIASVAGNYFAAATDGKYSSIELDTSLSMSYESDMGVKSAEHLSAGTRETAYLCLRLALVKLIYGAANVPLFLDDAFAHTDDKRLTALLRLLAESGNQVIIASCTEREAAALAAIGADYDSVEI